MQIAPFKAALAAVVLLAAGIAQAAELPQAKPEQVGLSSERLGKLRQVLAADVEAGKIPGAVWIVARHGKIAAYDAVGWRDAQAKAAMTKDSIFRIYSMSKPITTVTAMMLYEDGKLALNDPLAKFIPAFKEMKVGIEKPGGEEGKPNLELVPAARPISLQDLMRHTSGLTYGGFGKGGVKTLYQEAKFLADDPDNATFVERLAKLPLVYQPGSTWEYSHATDVLGRVVEVVSGQSLYEAERQRVLGPLGMQDTGFTATGPQQAARVAEPLPEDRRTSSGNELFDPRKPRRWQSGGGGMVGTAMDYARFLQMLLNGGTLDGKRYLGARTVAYMTSDHLGSAIPPSPFYQPVLAGYGFGLGFAVRRETGLASVPGSAGDYNWAGAGGTLFWVDPKEDLYVVVMIQAPSKLAAYRALARDLVYAAIQK